MNKEEKKNSRIALSISLGVHLAIILIALFFVGCWTAPGPPWPDPEVGFEVDFGTDIQGSGDLKTENEPIPEESPEETTSPNETEPQEQEPTEPTETSEPTDAVDPVDPVTPTDNVDPVDDSTNDTPVDPIDNTVDDSETPVDDSQTTQQTSQTQPSDPTPPTDVIAPSNTGGNNNGDDNNTVGDKGNPDSQIATDKYDGTNKPGGGEEGNGLSIHGWNWESAPKEERIKKQGQIVFEFTVDEYGEVISHDIISSTFLPAENDMLVEKLYNITFVQTSSGRPPEYTKGRLVWKFKSK